MACTGEGRVCWVYCTRTSHLAPSVLVLVLAAQSSYQAECTCLPRLLALGTYSEGTSEAFDTVPIIEREGPTVTSSSGGTNRRTGRPTDSRILMNTESAFVAWSISGGTSSSCSSGRRSRTNLRQLFPEPERVRVKVKSRYPASSPQ